jgi:hypothetical protein
MQLPIPVEPKTTFNPNWVRFEITDYSLANLSRHDFQSISAFFEAATEYAQIVGFARAENYYDPARMTTIITFYR